MNDLTASQTSNQNSTESLEPSHKKRIQYIDAMRGLTMLLVVYNHIHQYSYQSSMADSFNETFVKFRMPLFFFISGWVLYKSNSNWNLKMCSQFLHKKFNVQILSTVIFGTLYVYTFHLDFYKALGTFKAGYWFTYTLFFYFFFYAISAYLSKSLFKKKHEDSIILIIATIIFLTYYFTVRDQNTEHIKFYEYVGVYQWRYYMFFCFGIFVKKYFNSFVKTTDNSYLMALFIATFFLLGIFTKAFYIPFMDTISYFLYGFLGIIIVFTIFRRNSDWFSKNQNISKWMQYVGRHTLDIYLLHFFFLPRNLQFIGKLYEQNPNPTIELFITILFSISFYCNVILNNG